MRWVLVFFLLISLHGFSLTDYECSKKYKYSNGIKLKDNKGAIYIDDLVPENYFKAIIRTKKVLESIANIHLDIKKTGFVLSKFYTFQKKKKFCEYRFKKDLEKGIYVTIDNNQDCIENPKIAGLCSFFIRGCQMSFPTLIILYKNKMLSDFSIQSTTSHEIGHAIGLDHPSDKNTVSVMSYKYGWKMVFFSKEDVDVLQKIYGPPNDTQSVKLDLYRPLGKENYYCVIGGKYPFEVNKQETTCRYENTYDVNCWKVKHENCFFVVNSADNQKLILDDKGDIKIEGYNENNSGNSSKDKDKSSKGSLGMNNFLEHVQHYQLVISILFVILLIISIVIFKWYWKQRRKDELIAQIYNKAIYDIWIYLPKKLREEQGNPENLKKLSKDKEKLKAVLKKLEIEDLRKILERIYTQPNREFYFDSTPVKITAFEDDSVRLRDAELEGIELVIFYRGGNYYLRSNSIFPITVNGVDYVSNIEIPLDEVNIIEFREHELKIHINKDKGSVNVQIIR